MHLETAKGHSTALSFSRTSFSVHLASILSFSLKMYLLAYLVQTHPLEVLSENNALIGKKKHMCRVFIRSVRPVHEIISAQLQVSADV